jgi:hypothetical protein
MWIWIKKMEKKRKEKKRKEKKGNKFFIKILKR